MLMFFPPISGAKTCAVWSWMAMKLPLIKAVKNLNMKPEFCELKLGSTGGKSTTITSQCNLHVNETLRKCVQL